MNFLIGGERTLRTIVYSVPAALDSVPLRFLLRREMRISSSLLKTLKWCPGAIMLNGNEVHINAIAHTGDMISVTFSEREITDNDAAALDLPLDILYEDEDLLVLNKPAGLAMHPMSTDLAAPNLAGAVIAHLGSVPHFVSRLDKGTSGLLICAKSGYVHELFRRALHTEQLRREYRALAVGHVLPVQGTIDRPIGRAEGSIVKRSVCENGAPSRTEYEVLRYCGNLSLLRLSPLTGRTHQLRVHMSSLGYPLAGDWLYGVEDHALIDRPALHSYELWFTHPITGKPMHFVAPIPDEMQKLIKQGSQI